MIPINDSLKLKPIALEDHSKLLQLIQRIYPPAYRYLWNHEDCGFYFDRFYSLSNLKKELDETEAEYYFVYYNTNLVGILRILFDKTLKSMPEKSGCYLNRIYLSEEAQGQGIANELFKWVEQKAKLKGNDLIWLEAMDSKPQALKFYIKQGLTKSHKAYLDFKPLNAHLRGMEVLYKLIPR